MTEWTHDGEGRVYLDNTDLVAECYGSSPRQSDSVDTAAAHGQQIADTHNLACGLVELYAQFVTQEYNSYDTWYLMERVLTRLGATLGIDLPTPSAAAVERLQAAEPVDEAASAEVVFDLMGLIDNPVEMEWLLGLTQEQRDELGEYAIAVYLRASDNIVHVPKRPSFLPE